MNSYTHVYELIISGINKITVVTRHKAEHQKVMKNLW